MTELRPTKASHDELADALDVLHRLGASGMVNFAGHEFDIGATDNQRENHPGTNSPYVRILGEDYGLLAGTAVVMKEDFYAFVEDFHSSGMVSATRFKQRAGSAWEYLPTYVTHERGSIDWSIRPTGSHWIIGVDPQEVIDFFDPYPTPDSVPKDGLLLGPVGVKIWHSFAQHLAAHWEDLPAQDEAPTS